MRPEVNSARVRLFVAIVFTALLVSCRMVLSAEAQAPGEFVAAMNYSAGFPLKRDAVGQFEGHGIFPLAVVAGDFNGDGVSDIAVSAVCTSTYDAGCPGVNANVVIVYPAKGDGSFGDPIFSSALTGTVRSIAVADLNHDGKPDIVAVSDHCTLSSCYSYYSTVSVLLGAGDGTFFQINQFPLNGNAGQTNYGAPDQPKTLATGDLRDKGYPDVVVGVGCFSSNCAGGAIAVFPGDGSGKLGAATYYKTALSGTISPVVSDFTGDGHPDIAATVGNATAGTSLAFLANKGDGTFPAAPQVTPLTSFYPQPAGHTLISPGIVTADFNGDGKSDLALLTSSVANDASKANTDVTAILFGQGNGTFHAGNIYPTNIPPLPQSPLSSIRLNPRQQSLSVAQLSPGTKPDLVIGGSDVPFGYTANFFATVLQNNGTGAFYELAPSPVGENTNASIAVADYNNDGKLDVVFAGSQLDPRDYPTPFLFYGADGIISVALGNGNGTFQTAATANVAVGSQVLVDMNGDGIPDLVGTNVPSLPGLSAPTCCVYVAFGTGAQTFAPKVAYNVPATTLAVGDINGDGYPDVVIDGSYNSAPAGSPVNAVAQVEVMLGSRSGSLGSPTVYPLSHVPVLPIAIGDFAGSGKRGAAVVYGAAVGGGTFAGEPYYSNEPNAVSILTGNGDGTLQPEVMTQSPELTPFALALGDFNHDGKDDAALMGYLGAPLYNAAVTVFLSNGDGTLSVKHNPDGNSAHDPLSTCQPNQPSCAFPASYPTFGGGGPITAADINGDGNLDLVIANQQGPAVNQGYLRWLYGFGDGTFNIDTYGGPNHQLEDNAMYDGVTVADVNGDGKNDVVLSTYTGVDVFLAPFTAPATVYQTHERPTYATYSAPSVGDINRDGGADILVNNGTAGQIDVLLNRDGLPLEGSPGTVYFASVPVGTPAPTQDIPVRNAGGAPLNLKSITISGPGAPSYSIVGNTCGTAVAAKADCNVTVQFTPKEKGLILATMSITDNAARSPQQVALRGGGR